MSPSQHLQIRKQSLIPPLINSNVTGAQRELLKYYASITSNRWLMLKIFGVLIIFVRSRNSQSRTPTDPNDSSWSSSSSPRLD